MTVFTRIFAAIGVLATSSFLMGILIGLFLLSGTEESLPNRMVLNFDFREKISERGNGNPIAAAMGEDDGLPLRILIAAIDRAAKDDRVVGMTARVADASLNYSQVEEVRSAIKRFREEGKFAYAFADTFGQISNANRQYWLATAFDKIWLQPLGTIGLTGTGLTMEYAGEALEKIGVTADIHQRYEYKGAGDRFTKSEMPEPVRENYTRLLNDINEELISSIAQERDIPRETLLSLMDKAPIFTQEAKDANLVDVIGYRDEFYHAARWEGTAKPKLTFDETGKKISPTPSEDEKSNEETRDKPDSQESEHENQQKEEDTNSEEADAIEAESTSPATSSTTDTAENDLPPFPPEKPEELEKKAQQIAKFEKAARKKLNEEEFTRPSFIHPLDYYHGTQAEQNNAAPLDEDEERHIAALIHAEGPIVRLSSENAPLRKSQVAAADTIVSSIKNAAWRDDIKAIVLRIDSPGGSVTASESIRRALEEARKKGKYVVVSMGGTAASGGYWIATAADRIIANPTTITGSIGVVSGKFAVGDLANRLGINFEEISTSKHGGMWSPAEPFSPDELERLNAMLDNIYEAFTSRVSESRNLSPEEIDQAARGRVWTGKTAKELGLIDELGGLKESYLSVRHHLHLSENTPLYILPLPEETSPLEEIMNLLKSFISGGVPVALTISPEQIMQMLSEQTGLLSPAGNLSAPRLHLN